MIVWIWAALDLGCVGFELRWTWAVFSVEPDHVQVLSCFRVSQNASTRRLAVSPVRRQHI